MWNKTVWQWATRISWVVLQFTRWWNTCHIYASVKSIFNRVVIIVHNERVKLKRNKSIAFICLKNIHCLVISKQKYEVIKHIKINIIE